MSNFGADDLIPVVPAVSPAEERRGGGSGGSRGDAVCPQRLGVPRAKDSVHWSHPHVFLIAEHSLRALGAVS